MSKIAMKKWKKLQKNIDNCLKSPYTVKELYNLFRNKITSFMNFMLHF